MIVTKDMQRQAQLLIDAWMPELGEAAGGVHDSEAPPSQIAFFLLLLVVTGAANELGKLATNRDVAVANMATNLRTAAEAIETVGGIR